MVVRLKAIRAHGGWLSSSEKALRVLRREGVVELYKKMRSTSAPTHAEIVSGSASGVAFDHDPLISVLVVSYNSDADLTTLFDSLSRQSYSKFEVVLVENGSSDTKSLVQSYPLASTYLHADNIGFAAGNNLALENSEGEFVFLINPDTRLREDAIQNLLNALKYDRAVGISVPKTLFWEKFIDVTFSSDKDFSISLANLSEQLNYKKYFINDGTQDGSSEARIVHSHNRVISLRLPVDGAEISLEGRGTTDHQIIHTRVGHLNYENTDASFCDDARAFVWSMRLDRERFCNADWVINNSGSGIDKNGPYDIGFSQLDLGVDFDTPCYVDVFCGVAAMVSRAFLLERKLFIDEFFAYFEDTEFSHWCHQKDIKIKYVPRAVVWHRHSSSSEENSPLWKLLTSRSRAIYDQIVDYQAAPSLRIRPPKPVYKGTPKAISQTLKGYDRRVSKQAYGELIRKPRPSAGIYNSYWNTKGGGEAHALQVAKALSGTHDVYLLSESDFDLPQILGYFDVELEAKKLVRAQIDTKLTSAFDVFVNSTYCSRLISHAKNSFYVTSFPFKRVDTSFLQSYHFLHNSDYTNHWAHEFWGDHLGSIVYPTLQFPPISDAGKRRRKKTMLSVGRFTRRGHAKRQDTILKAFRAAVESEPDTKWELRLIGSLDGQSADDLLYFKGLREEAKGFPVKIYQNVSPEFIRKSYAAASVYVHATGFGQNPNLHPERLEHFGISTFEAVYNGCFPVVFNLGGPADVIRQFGTGRTFEDEEQLTAIMLDFFRNRVRNSRLGLGQTRDDMNAFLASNHEKLAGVFTPLRT